MFVSGSMSWVLENQEKIYYVLKPKKWPKVSTDETGEN